MRAMPAIGRIRFDQQDGCADNMGEPQADFGSGLINVTEMSLGDLASLDDAVIEVLVCRLLPACGGTDGRLWDQGTTMHEKDGEEAGLGK
jgi:hypothetical protein